MENSRIENFKPTDYVHIYYLTFLNLQITTDDYPSGSQQTDRLLRQIQQILGLFDGLIDMQYTYNLEIEGTLMKTRVGIITWKSIPLDTLMILTNIKSYHLVKNTDSAELSFESDQYLAAHLHLSFYTKEDIYYPLVNYPLVLFGKTMYCGKDDKEVVTEKSSWTDCSPYIKEIRHQNKPLESVEKYGLHFFDGSTKIDWVWAFGFFNENSPSLENEHN